MPLRHLPIVPKKCAGPQILPERRHRREAAVPPALRETDHEHDPQRRNEKHPQHHPRWQQLQIPNWQVPTLHHFAFFIFSFSFFVAVTSPSTPHALPPTPSTPAPPPAPSHQPPP